MLGIGSMAYGLWLSWPKLAPFGRHSPFQTRLITLASAPPACTMLIPCGWADKTRARLYLYEISLLSLAAYV